MDAAELEVLSGLSFVETSGARIHPTRVFVGGLARGTTELELENFFSDFGAVVDVRIVCDKRTGLNKGYGFVTYDSQEPRDNLLKKGMVDFHGRKLRLRQAVRRKGCGQFDAEQSSPVVSTDAQGLQWVLVPLDTIQATPSPTVWPQYGTYVVPPKPSYYSYNYVQPHQAHNQQGTTYYYCM